MDNLVSVLIPCYNAEQYLDRSIGSVYSQDYPKVELIVINDGSTDNSECKILSWKKLFAEKGFVLKYIYQDNQGQGKAIDTGLKLVTGEYLTLLDADDRFLPESIGLRAQFLDTHPECSGVRSNGWMVTGKERQLFITDEREKNITDLFAALTNGSTNNWAGTYMVRTDVLFDIYTDRNIYPSRMGQNFQILLPVAYRNKIGYIDVPLMEYYINENSHSHANNPDDQYYLGERNANGWKEIYSHVLNKIEKDESVRQVYLNEYNARYCRGGLHRAVANNKPAAIQTYYRKLVATGKATLNDRIVYYNARRSPIVILLKIVRRIKRILLASD